tara:strand:+ start:320 stop:556 length:237 start_codon:yes stop_codon:yes gene_type:complete
MGLFAQGSLGLVVQEIGSSIPGSLFHFGSSPGIHRLVVSTEEDLGYGSILPDPWSGVVRCIEQSSTLFVVKCEGILCG